MVRSIFSNGRLLGGTIAYLFLFLAGLALTRLLYEAAFPSLLWLARPVPVFLLAFLFAGGGLFLWRAGYYRLACQGEYSVQSLISVWALAPLLLNLVWLINPSVNLVYSRFIFAASIWLTTLFIAHFLVPERSWPWLGLIFIVVALLPVYLLTIPQAVGSADTFEFQVVIPQLGIAHPTGYPLYILLGRLFTFIPAGSMAWRVNLASAVFTLLASAFIYAIGLRLLKRPLPALLAAVFFGLTPVIWSQAIEAEVYALHALFVAAGLWLMLVMVQSATLENKCAGDILAWPRGSDWRRLVLLLALLLGFGLTNHLTTLFLLPPALLAILLPFSTCLRQQSWRENLRLILKALLAFTLPLLLYAYLPLRWSVLHGEGMGLARFVDWVIGGRFQGALQLTSWLTELTRYQITGRLLLQNWGWLNLGLTVIGMFYLLWRQWRLALLLILTWLGFIFYALNYIVPDLAVFIIPAHVVMALFWGAGLAVVLAGAGRLPDLWKRPAWNQAVEVIMLLLLLLPALQQIANGWPPASESKEKLLAWGEGVLALPLSENAAILADSEKIAPLYYLQQAEGLRPDLEIMVLPDEAAYRAELDARLAAGQVVYLARFLPGLEGIYHLRSLGPLIEVSTQAFGDLPQEATNSQQEFGALRLSGYTLQEQATIDPASTAVTLFWEATEQTEDPLRIYVRWAGDGFVTKPDVITGQHPAANYYPVAAWRDGEIVPDFHLLSRPIAQGEQILDLQVAVGPPFTPAADLTWQTITQITLPPAGEITLETPQRAQNGRILLSGVKFPDEIRPQKSLPIIYSGYGQDAAALQFSLQPLEGQISEQDRPALADGSSLPAFVHAVEVNTDLPNGRYRLVSVDPQAAAVCGWLARPAAGCVLGEVQISGVPLPQGAINYEDKIALLNVDLPAQQLQPGGDLPVTLRWQSLSPMNEDYTVFLQVLDDQERIVGQIDAWPLQGTFPTSQWAPGEIITDPYLIRLDSELPPGSYRLQIGWYLLSTLRRLSIVDDEGLPLDDKLVVSGLIVP